MKITDESMAKAFGWVRVEWRKTAHGAMRLSGIDPKLKGKTPYNVPEFTTSLDAITGEIEARGLSWTISTDDSGERNGYWAQVGGIDSQQFAATAPLALCAATLAYFKVKP